MAGLDIGILLYEGFDELSAVIPHAVFARAAEDCDLSVTTYSLVPSQGVRAASGLELAPDDVLIGTPDLVVVPGGPWDSTDESGGKAVPEAEYTDRLSNLSDGGAGFAAVSAGVFLLGKAGLLEGRRVACQDVYRDQVNEYGATVEDDPVVTDGDIVTAGGPGRAFDLALHVIDDVCGETVAAEIASDLEVVR